MNSENKIYYNSHEATCNDFSLDHHSTLLIKTKSFLNSHDDLVKSSSLPVPIFTVKYKKPIIDHTSASLQKQQHIQQEGMKNYLKLNRQYNKKLITKGVTTVHMKRYIDGLAEEQYDLCNLPRGSIKALEQNHQNFIVQVHNENSMKALKMNKSKDLKFDKSDANKDRLADELMLNQKFAAFRRGKIVKVAPSANLKDNEVMEATQTLTHENELIASSLIEDQLVTLDRDLCVRKWDLKFEAVNFRYKLPPPEASFNRRCFLPYSIHTLISDQRTSAKLTYTNAYNFGLIDSRINAKAKERHSQICFDKHFSMCCEKLYNHTHSRLNENQSYVVSSHMLYIIDHRQFKEPLVRWAHQINEPAMMISTDIYFNTEVIALSSRLPGDLKIFNYDQKSINLLPFRPLTIQNSYNNLREIGHFLLSSEIQDRIGMSTTGIAVKSEQSKLRLRLLIQNGAGDIYSSKLECNESMADSDNIYKPFQQWDVITRENQTAYDFLTVEERVRNEDFAVTDIARMGGLKKILLCENLQAQPFENDDENVDVQPQWRINIQDAVKCQDVMAREIMAVWDDTFEDVARPSIAEVAGESSHDRVSKWLQAANAPNVVIEEISFKNDTSLDNTLNFSQALAVSTQAVDVSTQELNTTQGVSQSVKKKKPRVAGF